MKKLEKLCCDEESKKMFEIINNNYRTNRTNNILKVRKKKEKTRKIVLTVLVLVLSVVIYVLLGQFGEMATKGDGYTALLSIGWIWMFFGQFGAIAYIWEI